MIKRVIFISLLLNFTLISTLALSQEKNAPYTGQQHRQIKSLSHKEVQGFLNGKGMGFAKAAELNHYPGPKHVLELSGELNLSDEQIQKTKNFYDEMHKTTSHLGKLYIQKEMELDRLFVLQSVEEVKLNALLLEIGEINSKIRFAHLKAHLQMKDVLSPKQIEKYDQHRGYHQQNKMIHHNVK